ncbi:MAG: FtsX-like permease family protein, partial [Dehalococcoidia bacterium]|nr:FtsX-like permease family protein [Dehalococcoidia bacterium]
MLQRKLYRDFKASKGLFAAVTVIILLAVAFFGSMFMAAQNLSDSYDYSYQKLRFADFTLKVTQDARQAIPQLEEIEGILSVTGRINADFAMGLPQSAKSQKVQARVISLPSDESIRATMVNDVYVEKGGYFPDSDGNSILVEKNFADHHSLEPGQTLVLSVAEREVPFTIAGIATSPEYVFPAKSRQEIIVSANVWGVVFVSNAVGTGLLDQPVNEFCFLVKDGFDRQAVMAQAQTILNPYQIMDIVPREDQPSYDRLQMDLEQFNTLAELFPLLFIIVGAMATYILLTRIVYNQRTQIGLMRAVGYSRGQVMRHYLGFALIIGIGGSVLGSILGYFLSEAITTWYAGMINLPFTRMTVQ